MNRRQSLLTVLILLICGGTLAVTLFIAGPRLPEWWRQQTLGQLPFDDPDTLYEAAERQYNAGNLGMAHDIANRATMLSPDHLAAHKLLAVIYFKQKNYKKAEEACRKAVSIAPQDNSIKVALGMALKNQGRLSEAEKVYTQVIRDKNPSLVDHEVLEQLQSMQEYAAGKRQPSPSPSPAIPIPFTNFPTEAPASPGANKGPTP